MRRSIYVLISLFAVAAIGSGAYLVKDFYDGLLSFELAPGEAWHGGSREAERRSFLGVTKDVAVAQLKGRIRGQRARVFHAKQHACLTGTLRIATQRPQDPARRTFHGIFDPAATGKDSYPVLARFSNGLGIIQHDKNADVRGLAIKVLDVFNTETRRAQTIDFTMTNSPVPAGRDIYEFVAFMRSVSRFGPTIGTAAFAAAHPRAGKALFAVTGVLPWGVKSLATTPFWSGHPYRLGPTEAMKLNVAPTVSNVESKATLKTWGANYLRWDLAKRFSQGQTLRYELRVQLPSDARSTPIEDTLDEWTEQESPSIAVATLEFPPQSVDPKRTPEKESACEKLGFTPGNYIPEHRPLGNMGRGRIFAYRASQLGRGAREAEISTTEWQKLVEEGKR